MKRTILVTSTILIAISSLWAQEIQVSTPLLVGKVPVKVRKYDNAAKTWGEVDGFKYEFMVYLKNISEKPLTVVTDMDQQTSPDDPKQKVELDMGKSTIIDGGALVVPPREELRLVDLRPGEVAAMKIIELEMAVPLEEITVTYSPKDFYDGRFGYWTGKVSSAPLKIGDKK